MKTINRRGMLQVLGASTMSLGTLTRPSFGAKPAPPPPLPPVRYQIQYWDIPTPIPTKLFGISSMNNLGQAVGWYVSAAGDQRAYLYDPEINPAAAVDLETEFAPAGIPDGWQIAGAIGINNEGLIVGQLKPVGNGSGDPGSRAFVLDLAPAIPQLVALPNWHDWDSHYARKINDNGDILGAYENADGSTGLFFCNLNNLDSPYILDGARTYAELNNPVGDRPAQVGGTFVGTAQAPFRWTPQTNSLETFGSLTTVNFGIRGINDAGAMCGSTSITTVKPPRTTTYPFRLNVDSSVQLLSAGYGAWATSINASGDVLLYRGGIYRDDWAAYGYYADINKLVVNPDGPWASMSIRECLHMNVREAGEISGRLLYSDNTAFQPFLLTPVAP